MRFRFIRKGPKVRVVSVDHASAIKIAQILDKKYGVKVGSQILYNAMADSWENTIPYYGQWEQ